MRLEAVTGRAVLETATRSCCTAEFPAGNPATPLLLHGPEALRHCLATVLPIAVFRRNMPRLVRMVVAIAIEVNKTRQMVPSDRGAGLVVAHNMSRASIAARNAHAGRRASGGATNGLSGSALTQY